MISNYIERLMAEINLQIGDIPKGPERNNALDKLARDKLQNPGLNHLEQSIYKNLLLKKPAS